MAAGPLQLTVVNEATFVEWLQRLQASAYLFSLGGASVHAPVAAIAMRVRACVRACVRAHHLQRRGRGVRDAAVTTE